MIAMIEQLIAAGHAYAADGHVLFDVSSKADYGKLSRRSLDEMIAGARVEVAPYKKKRDGFRAVEAVGRRHAGLGFALGPRPSRLAYRMLGDGGRISGRDLRHSWRRHRSGVSRITRTKSPRAKAPITAIRWRRSGCTTASCRWKARRCPRALGNFFTIRDLLADWPGEVLRFNMLRTHYRQPIDFTLAGLKESWKMLERWYEVTEPLADPAPDADFFEALRDDLNTPAAIASLHQADDMALAGGLGFLGFSNVQMKIAAKAKVDDGRHRRRHRGAQCRAQGQEFRGKRPHPRRTCWPRALC